MDEVVEQPGVQTLPHHLFFSTLPTGEHEFSCYITLSPLHVVVDTQVSWRISDPTAHKTHITTSRRLSTNEQTSQRLWIAATLPRSWPASHLHLEVQTATQLAQYDWTITHYQQTNTFLLPLEGQVLVLLGHRIGETHRAAWQVPAQQFAWDLLPLSSDGLCLLNGPLSDPLRATLFTGFGQDVLAPASGRVAQVIDHYPDGEQIGSYPEQLTYYLEDFRRAAGNHIILDHGAGVFSCLAHLQHHSICVQEHQIVTAQQVIGKLGHSGFSSGPHLHLHFMDGPDMLMASPLPIMLQAEGSIFAPQAGQIISS